MLGEKEEKKTLWYRFTSWVAASWLGRVVKWIADHTGISWALGKMKNLFGGKKGTATPEGETPESPEGNGQVPERRVTDPSPEPVAPKIPPVASKIPPVAPKIASVADDAGRADDGEESQGETANEENVIVGYIEILRNNDGEEQLMLRVPGYLITTFSQNRYNNPMYVQSYENVYQITYTKKYVYIDRGYCFPINSVKRQGIEGDAFCELDKMKNFLGFSGSKKSIAITDISPEPFTPGVSSYETSASGLPEGKEPERKVNGPNPEIPQPVKPKMLKKGGQANGGNKENPTVTSKPVSLGAGDVQESDSAETLKDKPVGYIKQDTPGSLQLLVHKDYEPLVNQNTGCYGIYVIIDENVYHIIGDIPSPRIMIGEYVPCSIHSVRTQDNESVNTARLLQTEAKITRISDTPSKKPEVESPANDGQPNPSFTQTTASAAPSGPSLQ